jgi:hypothetical protein
MNHEQDDHRLISPSSGLSRDLITGGSSKRWIQFSIWNRLCGGNQSHPTSFPIFGGIYFPEWALMMTARLMLGRSLLDTGFIDLFAFLFAIFLLLIPRLSQTRPSVGRRTGSCRSGGLCCILVSRGSCRPTTCAVRPLPFRPACLGDDVRLWFWWLFWGVDLLYADNILVCCRCWIRVVVWVIGLGLAFCCISGLC